MKFYRKIGLALIFILLWFDNMKLLAYVPFDDLTNVFNTFSGLAFIDRFFQIYLVLFLLTILPFFKELCSENIIRINTQQLLNKYMIEEIKYAFLYCFMIYGILITYYFLKHGSDSRFINIILSSSCYIVTYSLIFIFNGLILMGLYMFSNKLSISFILTVLVNLLVAYKWPRLFGNNFNYYEQFFKNNNFIIFNFLRIFFILLLIIYLAYQFNLYILRKRDYIYEDTK